MHYKLIKYKKMGDYEILENISANEYDYPLHSSMLKVNLQAVRRKVPLVKKKTQTPKPTTQSRGEVRRATTPTLRKKNERTAAGN